MSLLKWYDENKRALPWRRDTQPYPVWISEIMLQQTRVEAVIPYYERFMSALPDVHALADTSLENLYKLWEGLGYYTRPRMLHAAAQIVSRQMGGHFPDNATGLRALPGIGEYTAGAVASICFGERAPAIDGNVLRVFARYLGIREEIERPGVRRTIKEAVLAMMPADRPGDFNQALMELGATVCTPKRPRCLLCPWQADCDAFCAGDAPDLPLRAPKKDKKNEALHVAVILCKGRVLLRQRPAQGLLGGLWEFPHFERLQDIKALACKPKKLRPLPEARHVFTHRVWEMRGAVYQAQKETLPPGDYRWVDAQELAQLPIPTAMAAWKQAALEVLT